MIDGKYRCTNVVMRKGDRKREREREREREKERERKEMIGSYL